MVFRATLLFILTLSNKDNKYDIAVNIPADIPKLLLKSKSSCLVDRQTV